MTESVTVKTKPSFLGRLLRQLVGLALLIAIGILLFATWANHRRSGEWSFRVFDRAWWGIGSEEAQPYVDGAKSAARTAYQTTEELLQKAEAWLKRDPAEDTTDPAVSAPVTTDSLADQASDRERHEKALNDAQSLFEDGVVAYRQGKPADEQGQVDPAALRTAIASFKRVRDLLAIHIPAYNALPRKNLRILADAEELQALNQRLLSAAEQAVPR